MPVSAFLRGGALRAALVASLLLGAAVAGATAAAAGPALDKARSGPCVEDPKLMRRYVART